MNLKMVLFAFLRDLDFVSSVWWIVVNREDFPTETNVGIGFMAASGLVFLNVIVYGTNCIGSKWQEITNQFPSDGDVAIALFYSFVPFLGYAWYNEFDDVKRIVFNITKVVETLFEDIPLLVLSIIVLADDRNDDPSSLINIIITLVSAMLKNCCGW